MKEEEEMGKLTRLLRGEEGTSMVEWGLLAALIVIVCVLIMGALGVKLQGTFSKVNSALP